jgi:hypothetical protein
MHMALLENVDLKSTFLAGVCAHLAWCPRASSSAASATETKHSHSEVNISFRAFGAKISTKMPFMVMNLLPGEIIYILETTFLGFILHLEMSYYFQSSFLDQFWHGFKSTPK